MTQEEKQLLLQDLCARLPYGVKGVHILGTTIWSEEPETIVDIDLPEENIWTNVTIQGYNIEDQDFKPYLRPMSSMTEWEYKEFCKISGLYKKEEGNYFSNHLSELGNSIITERVMARTIDWLNTHHFDYRGLIEKGLALEAPEGMYRL